MNAKQLKIVINLLVKKHVNTILQVWILWMFVIGL